ncbi:MAG: hypothetical protein CME36_09660 [unclassified Hahellaceae]|nr:hypothetical protein [Hahellaceae bacterium]|tara:strand:- start:44541 stop:44816 length:276 start_codon:yes stop_codon:yes gene_type:complete
MSVHNYTADGTIKSGTASADIVVQVTVDSDSVFDGGMIVVEVGEGAVVNRPANACMIAPGVLRVSVVSGSDWAVKLASAASKTSLAVSVLP